jgi:hypothetical protein
MVDPVFEPPVPSIAVESQDPAPGATDVPRGSSLKVRFTAPLAVGYDLTLTQAGATLPGTTTLSADGQGLTFTPSQPFAKDVDVTVVLTDVVSTEGASLPTQEWTFHTSGDDSVAAPQSMFGDLVPAVQAADDGSTVELGTAFTPEADGKVTAIRFFKGPGNGGTHTGSLWSSTGQRLGTVTFTGESSSGWQTAKLATPVPVSEGVEYVVSYLAPQGHYSYTSGFFSTGWVAGDLRASQAGNGRYLYGGGFPVYSWNATNYFVDVVFVAGVPTISVTDQSPSDGAVDVHTAARPSISFSAQVADGYTVTARHGTTPIPGSTSLSSNGRTLTFTPEAPLPADADVTLDVSGVVSVKGAVLPPQSWTFHTETVATSFASLLTGQSPAVASAADSSPIELGMAFTPSVDGAVTAIKFYKGAGNTGTHTGSIWTSSGSRLATVTFTGETASGWQTAKLDSPLPLTAGETYVVSYFAPNGHYSVTGGFFTNGLTSGPLSAPSANNGRYLYAGGGGFPAYSWNASNYFVDVEFRYSTP